MTHKKRNERSALVKQSDQAKLDDAGYERPSSHADVIIGLEASAKPWGLPTIRMFGRAPADSVAGQTLAALPLCAILTVPALILALIGFFLVGAPLLTAGLTVVGFVGGAAFAWKLTQRPPSGPLVKPSVINAQVVSSTTPSVPVVLSQPEPEADAASS